MIEYKNLILLNKEKFLRVYKRGEEITDKMVEKYIKLGGAYIEKAEEKKEEKPKKKAVKKAVKKTTKKK